MAEIQSGLDTSDSGGVQGDLFGEDDSAMQEIVAISKAAGELVKENKQKIAAVSGAVKRPEIARKMECCYIRKQGKASHLQGRWKRCCA